MSVVVAAAAGSKRKRTDAAAAATPISAAGEPEGEQQLSPADRAEAELTRALHVLRARAFDPVLTAAALMRVNRSLTQLQGEVELFQTLRHAVPLLFDAAEAMDEQGLQPATTTTAGAADTPCAAAAAADHGRES